MGLLNRKSPRLYFHTFDSFSKYAIAMEIKFSPPIPSTILPKMRAVVVLAGMFLCLAPLLSNNVTIRCIVKFSDIDSSAALESDLIKRFKSAIFVSNMVTTASRDLIEFAFGPDNNENALLFYVYYSKKFYLSPKKG